MRLSLISGEECSLMKQRGRKKLLKKNAACCLHRPPSRAVIVLIFGGGAVRRSWQPGCIESGGWGFYKVLQDAFFFSVPACSRGTRSTGSTEVTEARTKSILDTLHLGHAQQSSQHPSEGKWILMKQLCTQELFSKKCCWGSYEHRRETFYGLSHDHCGFRSIV